MSNVLVTGGAGYVGAVLVPKLLARGHRVRVLDNYTYGRDALAPFRGAEYLQEIAGDIRDRELVKRSLTGVDAVLHLACISNDPSFELDSELGKSINFDCFAPLVEDAKRAGVSRFIYVSSSSVYGLSDEQRVIEEHPLKPLTDYSKYKALCEPVVLAQQAKNFTAVVLRPATVCGCSPRMRFDLSVNILTNHAVRRRKILVFGGIQTRPNIHIEDVAELYVDLLDVRAETIAGETFNVGFQNRSIADLAETVRSVVSIEFPNGGMIEIETMPTDDLRSYRVDSEKIGRVLGFNPRHTIEDAVRDICHALRSNRYPNSLVEPRYFNVNFMKQAILV